MGDISRNSFMDCSHGSVCTKATGSAGRRKTFVFLVVLIRSIGVEEIVAMPAAAEIAAGMRSAASAQECKALNPKP